MWLTESNRTYLPGETELHSQVVKHWISGLASLDTDYAAGVGFIVGCFDTFYDRLKGFTLCFFLLLQDNTFEVKMLQLATEQRVSDRQHAELRSDSQTFFWRQRRLEAELISLAELTVSGLGTSSVVKKSKKDRRKPKWPRLVNLIRLRSLLPPEQLCLWENVWITVTPSGGSDALMDGWEQKWGAWRYGAGRGGGGGGVDVRYPPAGTAPVRLLVEAEASPAFLRRARVWAQCTACTKQEGGKARKEKKKKEKQRGAEEEEKKGVRGGETKKDRKKETQELVRAGETTNRAVRSEKSHQVKLLVAGYSTAKHQ